MSGSPREHEREDENGNNDDPMLGFLFGNIGEDHELDEDYIEKVRLDEYSSQLA